MGRIIHYNGRYWQEEAPAERPPSISRRHGPQNWRFTVDTIRIPAAGDPFQAAAHNRDQDDHPCVCYSGWVFVGYEDEHGEEREASYRCRRCVRRCF
jgi:hypothetical protein